jgi:SAM-dependent methyltransferase
VKVKCGKPATFRGDFLEKAARIDFGKRVFAQRRKRFRAKAQRRKVGFAPLRLCAKPSAFARNLPAKLPYFCQNRKMTAEKQFINQVLRHMNPPPGANILEVGCGEGQNAREIAESGYEVTGIDESAEKISTALENEQEKLHFFTHDIRLPFFINYFDYALNLFSNFGFYRTEREHYNAIRTIANSLKPGGLFLIDYLNIHVSQNGDHADLTLGDFNDMFAFHGLQMQDVYGDYDFNAYDIKKSPRLIMIAQKK